MGLSFVSREAYACPITDTLNMPHIFANITNLLGMNGNIDESNKKEQDLREARTGNAGCGHGPTNKSTEIKSTAYDYLEKNFKKIKDIKICPTAEKSLLGNLNLPSILGSKSSCAEKDRVEFLKPQTNFEAAKREIQTKLFMEKPTKGDKKELIKGLPVETKDAMTSNYVDEVKTLRNKRAKYAEAVASTTYSIANEVRKKHKADMETLAKAQTQGCNQTQSHAMQNRNLKALIKAQAASIIIQIMAMEQEVAEKFITEPAYIITDEELEKALGDVK